MTFLIHITDLAFAFLIASGIVSAILFVFAIRAYRRTRNPAMAFVVAAFMVFGIKSLLVAYGLRTNAIEHTSLEFIDAIGDMAVLILFVIPILWPLKGAEA